MIRCKTIVHYVTKRTKEPYQTEAKYRVAISDVGGP